MSILLALALAAPSAPIWKIKIHSDPITDTKWASLSSDQDGNLLIIKCSPTKNPWSTTVVTGKFVGGRPMIRGVVFRVDSLPPQSSTFFADDYTSYDLGVGTRESKLLAAKSKIAFRINLGREGYGTTDAVFDATGLPAKTILFTKECRALGAPAI